ncbi:MAG: DUF4430 domain-containing protein [Raoultibacter sp.]
MNKKQRIVVGVIAGISALLIAVSAFFLVNPSAGPDFFSSDLLQTTTPSSSEPSGGVSAKSEEQSLDSVSVSVGDEGGKPASSGESSAVQGDLVPASTGGDVAGGRVPEPGSTSSALPPASEESAAPNQDAPQATITVSVSVSSSAAGGAVSGSAHPTFDKGATAYDALCATGLSVNATSSQYGIYVNAIGGLAEKEQGAQSGWLYSVNGVTPPFSCSNCILQDGDRVEWFYTV